MYIKALDLLIIAAEARAKNKDSVDELIDRAQESSDVKEAVDFLKASDSQALNKLGEVLRLRGKNARLVVLDAVMRDPKSFNAFKSLNDYNNLAFNADNRV
jgi:hypothetical protein